MLNLPLWIINLSGFGDCCVVEDDHETEILDHSGEYVVSHQYISNLTLNLRKNNWSDSWMPKKGACLKCYVFFFFTQTCDIFIHRFFGSGKLLLYCSLELV